LVEVFQVLIDPDVALSTGACSLFQRNCLHSCWNTGARYGVHCIGQLKPGFPEFGGGD